MSCVVVGVDGSDHSLEALRFAANEARLRNVALRVVTGWTPPVNDGFLGAPIPDPTLYERAAHNTMESMITAVASELEGVEVETVSDVGEAAAILDHCADADLVVVGSRGRGGFKGLLLGSVSHQVVQHAPCPVVVVRHAPER